MSLLKQRPKVPKILRSNPTKSSLLNVDDNDDDLYLDDDALSPGYRRRDLAKLAKFEPVLDEELSDYVQLRLILARAKALEKYREVYSKV